MFKSIKPLLVVQKIINYLFGKAIKNKIMKKYFLIKVKYKISKVEPPKPKVTKI